MSKIIKIIYVYLLNLLNINKILVTNNSGVKSDSKNNVIVVSIIAILYGFVIYSFVHRLNNVNSSYILSIGFIISSLLCLILNIKSIHEQLIVNSDRELLLSLPLTKNQIFISKLFLVYIKSLFYVNVIMLSLYIAVIKRFDETLLLMYLLTILIIPLIPIIIIISLIIVFNLIKNKFGNLIYNLFKIIFVLLIVLFFYFYTNDFVYDSNMIENMYNKLAFIYPLTYLFKNMLSKDYLSFALLMFIPIIFIYLYVILMANYLNNLDFKSLSKHVKHKLKYNKKGKFRSMLTKELMLVIRNKELRSRNIVIPYVMCALLLFVGLYLMRNDLSDYQSYFNYYIPIIYLVVIGFVNSTISIVSYEKDSFIVNTSLPIGYLSKLLIKIFANILLGLPLIVVFYCLSFFVLGMNLKYSIVSVLLPFVYLVFSSILGLILDIKNPNFSSDRNNIRLVEFVNPAFVVVSIVSLIYLYNDEFLYKTLYIYSFIFIYFILIFVLFIYLIIFHKKILYKMFNNRDK